MALAKLTVPAFACGRAAEEHIRDIIEVILADNLIERLSGCWVRIQTEF